MRPGDIVLARLASGTCYARIVVPGLTRVAISVCGVERLVSRGSLRTAPKAVQS